MNIVLFFLMGTLTLFAYQISRKNVFSPGFIICAVFTLSSVFVLLNEKNWDYSISINTLFYIVIALFVSLIGIYFGTNIKTTKSEINKFLENGIVWEISIKSMMILSIISIITVYMYFRHQLKLSITLGNGSGIAGMIYTLRRHVYDSETFQLGMILNIGICFLRANGFVSVFLLINHVITRRVFSWRYVAPIVSLLVYFILTTGRAGFITLTCVIMYDVYYSFKMIGKTIRPTKTILYIIVGFVLFLFCFWQLGKLAGKDTALNLWDTISIYIGSSILCFDKFMNNSVHNFDFIGVHTFKGLFNIFAKLGFNVTTISNHADMIMWNGYSSNVFSAFNAYYRDYGPYFSMLIIFFAGVIMGIFWKRFKDGTGKITTAIFYGRFIAYATSMYSISEFLFSEILALNALVEIFFMFFIATVFVREQKEQTEIEITGSNRGIA